MRSGKTLLTRTHTHAPLCGTLLARVRLFKRQCIRTYASAACEMGQTLQTVSKTVDLWHNLDLAV